MNNKFAPRIGGVKQEKIGIRPSDYSDWHRKLGPEYYAVDIDYVEYRKGKGIVALVAVTGNCDDEGHIMRSKPYIWQRTKLERQVLIDMSKALKVPALFVIHTKDLALFHVHNLNEELDKFKKMNEQDYAEFIKNL